ncbi:hypothetical protein [Faecalicatena contorta]|uniref:hypothetical protein n=1 Tax=Lachnospiraceae TaxID=186803 RepID=UPI001F3D8685|nr:hypothetical protein [Faecalicatena contorta]
MAIQSIAGVRSNRLDSMIKGRSVGSTVLNHRRIPELAPWNTPCGKISMERNRRRTDSVDRKR